MPPETFPDADLTRLKHMRDAIRETLGFVKDKTREDLAKDRMLVLSLIKEIEILGEAAGKISPQFQKEHPEIPWSQIVKARNRLIHGYFDIDLNIIWTTVTTALPPLLKKIEAILAITNG